MDFNNPLKVIYSTLFPNWRDDLSWSLGLFFHDEYTSVYGYPLDMTFGES